MRWRLILEEFGPQLNYIKGEKNIVADALSRLGIDTVNPSLSTCCSVDTTPTDDHTAECFGLTKSDLPPDIFPVHFKLMRTHSS